MCFTRYIAMQDADSLPLGKTHTTAHIHVINRTIDLKVSMINFLRIDSLKYGWFLIRTEEQIAQPHSSQLVCGEAAQFAHVTDGRLSRVYHTSSSSNAGPVTVEKVSIPKYGPSSNDDSVVTRASLRGVSDRYSTLGCCGPCGVCGAKVITGWVTVSR